MPIESSPENLIENPLKDLSKDNTITLQQILNNLLDGSKDLELKTHIFKPKALAGLKVIADYLEKKGYVVSSSIITNFLTTYLRNMVSYKRLSRTEIIKAFTFSNRLENSKNEFGTNLD